MRDVSIEDKKKSYAGIVGINDNKKVSSFYSDILKSVVFSHICPGDCVIEAGSYLGGFTTMMARQVGPCGRVVAFEPQLGSHEALQNRLERVGLCEAVELHAIALSDYVGDGAFYSVSGMLQRSGLYPSPEVAREVAGEAEPDCDVAPVTTLDAGGPQTGPVRLLWLDIEGGEFQALRGGINLLKGRRPLLVMRNWRGRAATQYGYSADEFFDFFQDVEYDLYNLIGFDFRRKDWTIGGQPGWCFGVPRENMVLKGTLHGMIDHVVEKYGISEMICC
ncbi:FkbM family methyltransferase [Rhodovarius crocodyli]|uniref:FkbM family methyltransferase n=1 Tax=Rhodovarius crocodyli TaxID=1979269 RepID=A0A437LYU6_9PROT|nr:FkbM family methyltransferase [Rhodovarius crocodyli]RVT90591.1 FkbM family methyltransferase [Rhodovarius crocodyli]